MYASASCIHNLLRLVPLFRNYEVSGSRVAEDTYKDSWY